MKKIAQRIIGIGLIGLFFSACKKDEIKTVMQAGTAPALTASANTLVLTAATAADSVETFSWTPANYGFSAAVSYTFQVAKAGTNFGNPKEISMGNRTKLKYTGADLNQLALIQGVAPGSAGQLDVRIKSSLSDSLTIFSQKITVTITPYLVIINYPSLWVPGDYQGWNAATAEKISSKLDNGIYEGFVNIPAGGANTFKYTSHPDWDHTIYGWAGSTVTGNNVTGTFVAGGGNLFVPSAGYYLLKGNTNDNSWSATKINSWSLSGDFNSWGDLAMTYSTVTKLWTATINPAAAGVFKFNSNNDWVINFGDTGGDLSLEYNGANIPITAGSHVITLNISIPGNYTYKIE